MKMKEGGCEGGREGCGGRIAFLSLLRRFGFYEDCIHFFLGCAAK